MQNSIHALTPQSSAHIHPFIKASRETMPMQLTRVGRGWAQVVWIMRVRTNLTYGGMTERLSQMIEPLLLRGQHQALARIVTALEMRPLFAANLPGNMTADLLAAIN